MQFAQFASPVGSRQGSVRSVRLAGVLAVRVGLWSLVVFIWLWWDGQCEGCGTALFVRGLGSLDVHVLSCMDIHIGQDLWVGVSLWMFAASGVWLCVDCNAWLGICGWAACMISGRQGCGSDWTDCGWVWIGQICWVGFFQLRSLG